jgi:urease subunit beta
MTVPGEVLVGDGPIELFDEATVRHIEVVNAGDRPIQVGSHYHFAEANPSLSFDREAAFGRRLAIPAGTSVRFEPGIERQVGLVRLGGRRIVPGLRGMVGGTLDGDGPGDGGGGPADGGTVDEGRPPDGGGPTNHGDPADEDGPA